MNKLPSAGLGVRRQRWMRHEDSGGYNCLVWARRAPADRGKEGGENGWGFRAVATAVGVSAQFPQLQCGAAVHSVTRQRGSKSKAALLMNIKQRVLLRCALPPSLSNHRAAEAAGCANPLSRAQNERKAETRRRGQRAHAITTKAAL